MRFLVAAFLVLPVLAAVAEPPGEFRPLFDGKSLDGWVVKGEPGQEAPQDEWLVKGGLLTVKPGHSWLSTKEMYGDYILRLEWRVPENGNSGVFLRVPDLKPGQQPYVEGIEIQVLDDQGPEYAGKLKEWQYAGSIYGVVAAANSGYKGAGEWNALEITCQGDDITVAMNGNQVAKADVTKFDELKNRPRRGYIGLQNHGTAVDYRNVQVKVLK
jgi:hypothetical protein